MKKTVAVVSPLPKTKNGYFSLKNALNSSLKRAISTPKIAMTILNISIADSLCKIPPLSQKIIQKKTHLKKRWAIPHKVLVFLHRLLLSVQDNYSKKYSKKGINVPQYAMNGVQYTMNRNIK
ncbi:hypothetical protein BKH42_06880 [Helicobacter sp. 13S00482-2]|nr:hypothetical protein BKH42_06880 [Helicobacter sp. 13S00482-2]